MSEAIPRTRLLVATGAVFLVLLHLSDPAALGSVTRGRAATKPLGRASAGMAYDIDNDEVVVFGGFASFGNPPRTAYLNDTWTWTGAGWTRRSPASSPPKGYGFAMAYDRARHNVVLFGGSDDRTVYDQTWTWDGTNWAQQHPATSPPASYGSVAVYDPTLGKVVVLLGDAYNPGTTWSWDGVDWAQETPTVGPDARVLAGGAFDESDATFLIFGGSQSCGDINCALGDTWTWDGALWTKHSPATSPAKRIAPAAAYDPSDGVVVLFGGDDFGSYRDTWTWDGSTWTQQHPRTSPGARSQGSMVWHDGLGKVLLFGGGTFAHNLHYSYNQLWSWDGTAWERIA